MVVYVQHRKEYEELKKELTQTAKDDFYILVLEKKLEELFNWCEDFIVNVINKDNEYYSKLSSYHFSNDDLQYCLGSGC